MKKAYDDQFILRWLRPLGRNDISPLVMTKGKADQQHIKTISELQSNVNGCASGAAENASPD